jgi:protoporphyrinogen oxidase
VALPAINFSARINKYMAFHEHNKNNSSKIAIVGGGITGLTAAYELTKAGHEVTVFEKEKYLGGLAFGFKNSDYWGVSKSSKTSVAAPLRSSILHKGEEWDWSLEYAYHHLFTNDNAILSLSKEIGIQDKLITRRPVTASLYNGKMYQLDSPMSLLKFPGMPLIDRIRTGIFIAALRYNPFWKPLENITAKELALSIGGQAGWRTIWEPLMTGKFSSYANSIAASWLWARIVKRTPSLVYFEGGFHTFITTLEKKVKQQGGKILTGTTIKSIELNIESGIKNKGNSHHSPFIIHTSKREHFDQVLLTLPTPLAAHLIQSKNSQLIENWKLEIENSLKIPHLHAQVMILETEEPILKDVYWLNITDRSFPFLAVVQHTNYMDKQHYGGHHLTYVGNYLPPDHPFIKMDKEQLLKKFLPYLKKLNPNLNSKFIIHNSYLFTGPFAQPVHQLHYSSRAPKLETAIPGLYLANMDSIYPWDRGTNYAVELGQSAASTILQK